MQVCQAIKTCRTIALYRRSLVLEFELKLELDLDSEFWPNFSGMAKDGGFSPSFSKNFSINS